MKTLNSVFALCVFVASLAYTPAYAVILEPDLESMAWQEEMAEPGPSGGSVTAEPAAIHHEGDAVGGFVDGAGQVAEVPFDFVGEIIKGIS